jgi:hypothetical protein
MEDAGFACVRKAGIVATRIIAALNEPFAIPSHYFSAMPGGGALAVPTAHAEQGREGSLT